MGKKTSTNVNKNKEKRQARKVEQRRIADGMANVRSANKITDMAALCKELLMFRNLDLEVDLYIQKVTELDGVVQKWTVDLVEKNMKYLYETCAWGWSKECKEEEMTDPDAWYLIAKETNGKLLGFSHFRFDMDFGEPVLYCYEVQVESGRRRRGLGQHIMDVLETLAHATKMRRVRLTVLTQNKKAQSFFRSCGYNVDYTSPPKMHGAHYEILSKITSEEDSEADAQK